MSSAEARWFARASAFNLIGQAIPLVAAVVTVRIIGRELAPEQVAIIMLAWTVASYFTLFDLGLGRAVTKLGAESITEDPARLQRLVAASIQVQLVFAVAIMLLVILAAPALARLLRVPTAVELDAIRAFRILALAVPVVLITNTYRGALEALRRFGLVSVLRTVFGTGMYALTTLGALLWRNTSAIVALIVLARVAGLVGHSIAYRAVVQPVRVAPTAAERIALLRFGGWVSVTSALVPLTVYIDRFLLGGLISLAAVAFYSVPYEFATRLLIIPGSITAVLLPTMSGSQADAPTRRAHFARTIVWAAIAPLPFVLFLFAAATWALAWVGPDYAAQSTTTFRILLLAVYVNGIALVPFTALESLGRPDLITKYHLVELPLYVMMTVLFISGWGIEGAAAAWLLRNTVVLLLLGYFARKHVYGMAERREHGFHRDVEHQRSRDR